MSATITSLHKFRSTTYIISVYHIFIGIIVSLMQESYVPRVSRRPPTERREHVDHGLPKTTEDVYIDYREKRNKRPQTSSQPGPQRHWLLSLGLGMVVMLLLVFFWQFAVQNVTDFYNDWHYGQPRTFQTDAFVGHEVDAKIPSHFIAVNLNGNIEVIELPGGDTAHTQRFQVTQLSGEAGKLIPVTLEFVDSQHTHHPDMIVHIQNTEILFHNTNGTFHIATN